MRNFDTALDAAGVTRRTIIAPVQTVAVTETVAVTQQPSSARTFLMKGDKDWSWQDLRDYVVHQIEQRFGVFPRDPKKEASIFKSFVGRHGEHAGPIARYAFEISDGYWGGAPVSVNRFCKASDPYFAEKILPRLVDSQVKGW